MRIRREKRLIIGVEVSQAAIKALASNEVNSRLVLECREALKKIETKCNVQICWVPGHKGYEENEKADKLTKQGSELREELSERVIYPSIQTAKRILTETAENIKEHTTNAQPRQKLDKNTCRDHHWTLWHWHYGQGARNFGK